jgi:hypothetical protein
MSNLQLSEVEKSLVLRLAAEKTGVTSRIWFYGSFVIPFLSLALYGASEANLVALEVAFGGLFAFVLWLITYELRFYTTYITLFRKIADHEGVA